MVANPNPSEIDAVHSSEGGSGSKPETSPSSFRPGHKRELEFALKSLSEVSTSSLCQTRPKSKKSSEELIDGASIKLLTKPPTSPVELIASGWIDGASIKLVNDDEENGLFAMIEEGRIFCGGGDTCRSVKLPYNLNYRE